MPYDLITLLGLIVSANTSKIVKWQYQTICLSFIRHSKQFSLKAHHEDVGSSSIQPMRTMRQNRDSRSSTSYNVSLQQYANYSRYYALGSSSQQ